MWQKTALGEIRTMGADFPQTGILAGFEIHRRSAKLDQESCRKQVWCDDFEWR